MELQHINVKLFVKNQERVDLQAVVPVFHQWIQNQEPGELMLDVADYRHVRSGPGVVLIGHRCNYSLDYSGGRLGIRYNPKTAVAGSDQGRLVQATQAALEICRRLESEPSLHRGVEFNGREIEWFINDRLFAPNTPGTRLEAEPEFAAFLPALVGDAEYALSYASDPRRLFSVHVTTRRIFDPTTLLHNLSSLTPVPCV